MIKIIHIYDHQCELFRELYIFNNYSTSINGWVNDAFSKELNEDALCPVEDEIVPCKCNYYVDPIPNIFFNSCE